jgi:hypothetical protein
MGMPKQVIAAKKMVEEAEEATRLQKEGSVTPNPETPPVEPVTTPVVPVVPVVVTPPVVENVLNWEEEYKTLHEKHGTLLARFGVMKGKYDSEVPILHGEIRILKAENDTLKAGGGDDTPALPGIETDISPANIKKLYGQELVDAMAAKEKVTSDRIKKLEERLSKRDEVSQDNAESEFYDALAKAHPDWKVLNETDAFLGFLKEYIPAMGMTRQQILDNAGKAGNPDPIINQLTEFKAHIASSSITSQVVPEDGGGSPPPADTTKRMIPESEIKDFYKNASIRIANDGSPETAKEVKRLDKEYDDAMRDGRILVGK